jgi:stearoyl-CoA desaturase (delta-9 desaturase)
MATSTTAAAMSHNLQALSLTRPSSQCRRSVVSCGIASRANVGALTAAFPRRELLGASVKGLVPLNAVSRVSCVLEGAPQQLEGDEGTVAPPSKIWLSDVVVRRRRNYFKNRQWTSKDLTYAGFMLFMHGLCLFAPATFSWNAFGVFMGLYVITGMLGITLSYHRNLSHKSFKVPKWLEYTFAYCGVQAVQGDPTEWVSSHRYHHQHCDTENDPHTPYEGFWHSHMGWLLDDSKTQERVGARTNVSDMEKDPFYNFIQKTYPIHPMLLALALYAVGGFPYIVWGMAMRTVWVYHITWFVNSASHVWGTQSWNTGDLSRNNWWVALLAFGEGWHNNHHAFEYSARHGLEWWQLDPTWWVIRGLEAVGLATKVKLPRKDQMEKLAFPSTS